MFGSARTEKVEQEVRVKRDPEEARTEGGREGDGGEESGSGG